jgi:hypothetical protein
MLMEENNPCLHHMMKLLKMMCHLLQWGGLWRFTTRLGDTLSLTIDLWGYLLPTSLIGTQLWSMFAESIRILWRKPTRRQGQVFFLGMRKRGHTSWTGCIPTWVIELPWRLA